MKYRKQYFFILIPLLFIGFMWLLTQAFHLISAPSDTHVFYGFLLLAGILALAAFLVVYLRNKKL
jgi:hypothetical protein